MDSGLISENGINICTKNTVQMPNKEGVVFNPGTSVNRSLILYSLGAYIDSDWCLSKTVRCLDAFGATGIAGLSWVKKIPNIKVTVNDPSTHAYKAIKENEAFNSLNTEITQEDVNVLFHTRQFDFVYLDCYGSCIHYTDSIFRHIPRNGLLVITSNDDVALFGKCSYVAQRSYGSYITKTSYLKELAARLIIAAIVRSAAKYNKGVEVLSSIAVKSHITLILKVTKGPGAATQCVNQVRKLLHCCLCEDRVFYPQSIHPIAHPYSLLTCDCRHKNSDKVAVELGPVWCGPIFDSEFCRKMLRRAGDSCHRVKTLLQTIVSESCGGNFDQKNEPNFPTKDQKNNHPQSTNPLNIVPNFNCFRSTVIAINSGNNSRSNYDKFEKGSPMQEGNGSLKRRKTELCPPFYFNIYRHCPKGYELGKIKDIIKFIQSEKWVASRTHFDPVAIRTSASLSDFQNLLMRYSKTRKNQGGRKTK